MILESGNVENFPSASAEMADVVAVNKKHKHTKGKLNGGQPQAIPLDEIVEPNVTISFGLHPIKYIANFSTVIIPSSFR